MGVRKPTKKEATSEMALGLFKSPKVRRLYEKKEVRRSKKEVWSSTKKKVK